MRYARVRNIYAIVRGCGNFSALALAVIIAVAIAITSASTSTTAVAAFSSLLSMPICCRPVVVDVVAVIAAIAVAFKLIVVCALLPPSCRCHQIFHRRRCLCWPIH